MNAPVPTSAPVKTRRWCPRFSLRVLLVLLAISAVVLAYFGNTWRRVKHQRAIVAKIKAAGGKVRYNWNFGAGPDLDSAFEVESSTTSTSYSETPDGRLKRTRTTSEGTFHEVETPPGPKVLRWMLGDDAFAYVEDVSFDIFETPGDFDPQLLLELPELKVVTLVGPQLNDEWLGCVARVPRLRHLSLHTHVEVPLTSVGVSKLASAKQLEVLSFVGDGIPNEAIAGISELRQLRVLQLASVPNVTSDLFPNLKELTNLRQLIILSAAKIDDRETKQLRRLTKLQVLWLMKTSISDVSLRHISELTELEHLDLMGTNVGDPGMDQLTGLKKLTYLNLGLTHVGDAGLPSITALSSLRVLTLADTKVTDAGMPVLARLENLEVLNLWPTALTDDGLLPLQALKHLRRLSVGPNISKEGADVLRNALPDCRVDRVNAMGHSSQTDG